MARLAHPNVVAVYDVGIVRRAQVFVAMEFVERRDARELARRRARARWREVLDVFVAAGARAWRPRTRRGSCTATSSRTTCWSARTAACGSSTSAWRAKRPPALSDGAAAVALAASGASARGNASGDADARPAALMGTPAYMAPEQHRRRARPTRAPISSASASRSTRRSTASGPFPGEIAAAAAAQRDRGRHRTGAREPRGAHLDPAGGAARAQGRSGAALAVDGAAHRGAGRRSGGAPPAPAAGQRRPLRWSWRAPWWSRKWPATAARRSNRR